MKAIAENIETELAKHSIRPAAIEGMRFAHWVLMDYGDVIVHVFEEETRAYYELEKFWLDAPRIIVEDSVVRPSPGTPGPVIKERKR